MHILGKLIMNLGKPTGNESKDVEGFGDWDQGAITKFGLASHTTVEKADTTL